MKIPRLVHEPSTPSYSLVLWLPALRYRMTARVLRRLHLTEMKDIYINKYMYVCVYIYITHVKFRAFCRLVQN